LEVSSAELDQAARGVLEQWDTDNDNLLSASEFEAHHPELGLQIQDPMAEWDTSGDGSLDESEFATGMYEAYDANDDQVIKQDEIANLTGAAGVQTQDADTAVAANNIVELNTWAYEPLYADGVSVDRLIGQDVLGPTGDDIGQVENVLLSPAGKAVALVAEVGGLWELGDTHVSIPWETVNVTADGVIVPVTEETVDDYSLFQDNYLMLQDAKSQIQEVDGDGWGEIVTGPRLWRATELIGDYARLLDGDVFTEYGLIDDIILRDGNIVAAVVSPDLAGRYYAYPYYGSGWAAGSPYLDLPYNAAEADTLEPFEYDQLETLEPAA
jgi:sporulation protein YlmC with PRC-barrel domain